MPTARNTWKSGTTRRSSNTTGRTTSRGGTSSTRGTTGGNFWTNTTRSNYGGTFGGTRTNNWSTNRGSTSTGNSAWSTTKSYAATQFSTQRRELNCKIESYRTINTQFSGNTRVTAFSPTTAKQWINFVDNGCFVYTFNNAEFCRFFGSQFNNCSPTQAFRTLRTKLGTGIKAVTRGKSNTWLVAATPRVTARPFSTYNW